MDNYLLTFVVFVTFLISWVSHVGIFWTLSWSTKGRRTTLLDVHELMRSWCYLLLRRNISIWSSFINALLYFSFTCLGRPSPAWANSCALLKHIFGVMWIVIPKAYTHYVQNLEAAHGRSRREALTCPRCGLGFKFLVLVSGFWDLG